MKEKVVLDEGDLAILEILDDPVLFGEFVRSAEEELDEGKGWHYDNYQRKMLIDSGHYVSIATGRSTGKTASMETRIIWNAISNTYRKASANEILLVVQNKAQLDPVFLRIVRFFRTHPLLKYFVDRQSVNMSNHEIRLLNNCLIRCRIVGSTADSNVIGLHVPCIYVDEAQVFGYSAWNSLMQCLTTWDTDFFLWVSGVPNGLREKNVLFECDQLDEKFSRHNVSRLKSIRYTKEQHDFDLKQYGGENGDDYVHLVLGEHGSPAFSVFDRKLMKIEDYPVSLSVLNNVTLEQCAGNFSEVLRAPDIPYDIQKKYDLIIAGIDAGFSNDPTIITILWRDAATQIWREFARFELRRIKYPVQAKIIDWLDTIYGFNMVAIDAGSSGLALCQILQDEDGEFKHKEFGKRLTPVDFQANVITGYDDEGKEIKDRVRKFTIQTLQKWTQNDQIITFSTQDDDVVSELERVGFTRDMLGQPKYFVYSPQGGQKGEDHILASVLTWVYGYYYNYYSPEKPKTKGKYGDLARGGWLQR
ncbi:MAG: hypothetical protein WC196_05925 [Bacilli bacterium]